MKNNDIKCPACGSHMLEVDIERNGCPAKVIKGKLLVGDNDGDDEIVSIYCYDCGREIDHAIMKRLKNWQNWKYDDIGGQ